MLSCFETITTTGLSRSNVSVFVAMEGTNSAISASTQHSGAGEETDGRRKRWGPALKTFCEKTTFHGLRNVTESTSYARR